MADVYISPSSQWANQFAGGGTGTPDSEHRHMRDIAPMLDDLLQRNGVDSKILWDTDLATRIRQSNANPPLLHFALHSNAGGTAYGASCWVYRKGTKSEVMARQIQATLAALTPWPDLGVIAYNHYETRETKAYAVIAEVAFHDKTEPAQWIRDHKRDIAVALARGIINALAKAYGGKFTAIAARPLMLDGGGGMAPIVIAPAPTTPAPAPPTTPTTPTEQEDTVLFIARQKDSPEQFIGDGITCRHIGSEQEKADLLWQLRDAGVKVVDRGAVARIEWLGKVVA